MKAIDSVLYHHILPLGESKAQVHPTLILLHGRGADEEDLLGLSSLLDQRFMVISVRAPYPFAYGGGFTWYDADQMGTPDATMFRMSYDKLSTFIGDVVAGYPVDSKQLYLLGFSMGTAMSYALALTKPGLFRAVVANSGYIAEGTHLQYMWADLNHVEFFVAHGTEDPVIPVQAARRAKGLLESAHARFEYKEYPMSHEISDQSLQDFSQWLTRRLDTAA